MSATGAVAAKEDAFFAKVKHVPLAEAAGHVAAEMVSPYPPGIPRVLPGERITDPYIIQLPADAPPGAYQAEIGLYLLSTGQRLPMLNANGVPVDDRLLLPGLQVLPR